MANVAEILDQGFACLVDCMGVIDAEHFISLIKRDDFNYTAWKKEYYDKMEPEEFGQRRPLMPKVIPIREKSRFCNREVEYMTLRQEAHAMIDSLPDDDSVKFFIDMIRRYNIITKKTEEILF